jgi:hypothetical protein
MICDVCKYPYDDYVGMYTKGEECPQCKSLLPKAKEWFGDGEVDIDLMIFAGAIKKEQIIREYIKATTKTTKVISGFPGVGKSVLSLDPCYVTLDSDSSSFSWIRPGERNPDFPNNYMQHIKYNLGKVDYILVSSHEDVRRMLREHNIEYTVVYPDVRLQEEYLKRYEGRGSDEGFISFIRLNWGQFIDDIEKETFPKKVKLMKGQHLADVLSEV